MKDYAFDYAARRHTATFHFYLFSEGIRKAPDRALF